MMHSAAAPDARNDAAPRHARLVLLVLLAGLIAFHARGLLPGRVLLPLDILCTWAPWKTQPACQGVVPANPVTSDQVYAFYPWRAAVKAGGWGVLLWNPYAFAGSPMMGNGQSALLYPPNWLHFALPPAWSYVLLALFRTALALLFTWLFARRHLSAAAAGLAAASYAFSYNFVFSLGYPLGDAAAWVPALFWALDRRRWVTLGIFSALELLSGQPQISAAAFLCLIVWFAFTRPAWQEWIHATAALLLGAVLAWPQLFLLFQYLRWSAAARFRAQFAPVFAPAGTLLDLLTPDFFGHAAGVSAWGAAAGGYFGLLPLLLIAGWLLSAPGRVTRNPFFWLFAGSVAIICGVPPLAWVMYLPQLRTVYVTKFWTMATFAGAMLAGYALDEACARRIRPVAVFGAAGAGLAVLLVARWHYRDLIGAMQLAPFETRVLILFAALAAAAVLLFRFGLISPNSAGADAGPTLIAVLAVAFVIVDAFVYLGHYNTAAPVSLLYPPSGATEFLKGDPGARIMGNGVLPPNTAGVYGICDVRGYDGITPWPYFRYLAAVDSSFPDLAARLNIGAHPPGRDTLFYRWRIADPLAKWNGAYLDYLKQVYYWNDRLARIDRPALLDLLGAKYFITPPGVRPPPGGDDYRRVYAGDDADVYENPHALPRAFVVPGWTAVATPPEALAAVKARDFDPRALAVLCCGTLAQNGVTVETPRPPAAAPQSTWHPLDRTRLGVPGELGQTATILSYAPTAVTVRAKGPGVLVLGDSYYPGWRAQPFPLLRVDYLFRGVVLPDGENIVTFYYRPALSLEPAE